MPAKLIVCHGREHYRKTYSCPKEDEPAHEFTLMVEHIIRFGKVQDSRFKTWLICRDMFREDIQELWLEETPEQIRQIINATVTCPKCGHKWS